MSASYFFTSEESQARLVATSRKWIGTPFHGHAAILGAGVDCVHLVAEIYKECGVIRQFNAPPYAMDGGQHDQSSKVIEYVEATRRFEQIWKKTPASVQPKIWCGDLLCFRLAQVEFHVGLALSVQRFLQCYQLHAVADFPLQDSTWANRLTAIYRPLAP